MRAVCSAFSKNGVRFTEKNIAKNDQFVKELIELGAQATPTTVIDGEVIIGFNRKVLAEKLGL